MSQRQKPRGAQMKPGGGSGDGHREKEDYGRGQGQDQVQGRVKNQGQGQVQGRVKGQDQVRDKDQGQGQGQVQARVKSQGQGRVLDQGHGQEQGQDHGQGQGQGQGQDQDQDQDIDQGKGQGQKGLQRLSQEFRRLRVFPDSPEYWRDIYKRVFEYDAPLFQIAPRIFKFVTPKKGDKDNPWKESFKQIYHGLHVRPGCKENEFGGHNIRNFETIHDALNYAKSSGISDVLGHDALIFVHAGTHKGEIVIDSNVALLGAAAGIVNSSVIVKGENETTLKFVMGAVGAYIGFISLKFTPKITPTTKVPKRFCLEISTSNPTIPCTPIIDECFIEHSSVETTAVRVSGEGANPLIKNCTIRSSKSEGIIVENFAQGTYQHNRITSPHYKRTACPSGICVKTMANPIVRKNLVSGYKFGITVSDKGFGVFEENRVVNNESAAFVVTKEGNPLVLHNILEHGKQATVLICNGGFGVFLDNQINARLSVGIECSENSNPIIKLNRIHNSKVGVNITGNGRGWFEDNNIFESFSAGICITSSNPIILENKIHHNRVGIRVIHKSRGLIELNKVYSSAVHGVRIETASTPVLQRNVIYDGQIGLHFQENSCGEIEDNVIFRNKNYNVKIESGSNPVMRRNKIKNGKHGGVSITNRGLGFLENNEIFENFAGVCIDEYSNPTLKSNNIYNNRGCGVSIVNNGEGNLEENKIFCNVQNNLLIGNTCNPTLRQNEILDDLGTEIDKTNNASESL